MRNIRKQQRSELWNHNDSKIDEYTARKIDEKYQVAQAQPIIVGKPQVRHAQLKNNEHSSFVATLNNLDKSFSKSIRRGTSSYSLVSPLTMLTIMNYHFFYI